MIRELERRGYTGEALVLLLVANGISEGEARLMIDRAHGKDVDQRVEPTLEQLPTEIQERLRKAKFADVGKSRKERN